MPDYVWTTKYGYQIPVREMTHTHLKNTIRHLKRMAAKFESQVDSCYGFTGGEMAAREAMIQADHYSDLLNGVYQWLGVMLNEVKRREKLQSGDDAIAVMQEKIHD